MDHQLDLTQINTLDLSKMPVMASLREQANATTDQDEAAKLVNIINEIMGRYAG